MRKAFIFSNQVNDIMEAYKLAPWASIIIEIVGGFMAFECLDQYVIWRKEKE